MQIPMLIILYSIVAIMILPFIYRAFSKYYNKSKGLSAFRLTIIEEMRKWQPLQEESV